jgi:ferredoxin
MMVGRPIPLQEAVSMEPKEMTAALVAETIRDFMLRSGENDLKRGAGEPAFAEPLVGFSKGNDPLYDDYKEHVGPFHWTPAEAFAIAFPGVEARSEDLTVVSWVLPQTERTKADNRAADFYPAERWARARIFGEEVNVKLRRHVAAFLTSAGYPAAAPQLLEDWKMMTSAKYGFASKWSERHAAYAAGLGTFGLCDGLITPLGKAMRTGSVVVRADLPATPRPYTDHRAYCLFFSKGVCGKCIKRCPVGAITEKGKDKIKCLAHLQPVVENYVKEHYGFAGYGCGLCQTGVPCESGIPAVGKGV